MRHIFLILISFLGLINSSCRPKSSEEVKTESQLIRDNFISEYKGVKTDLLKLKNKNGIEAYITNFGGRIVGLFVPDRQGNKKDIVLGFDNIEDYLPEKHHTDFGAAIGRYANRIKNGKLPIDGDTLQLPVNNFGHTLHGGPSGWQYKVYDVKEVNDSSLVLTIISPNGDNNFPGTVEAEVKYTLRNDNALDIEYTAKTDSPTVINMTNHSYFNLSGNPSNTIDNHELYVNASYFTPVDSTFIPTGEELLTVTTPMNLNVASKLGDKINNYSNDQISMAEGFDHNWILNNEGNIEVLAAQLYSPESGILMDVFTTEPGIQVYTGNFLDGTIIGKEDKIYKKHAAVCLETQHFPDSPNHPEWPSTLLRPGETYKSQTIYKFSTK